MRKNFNFESWDIEACLPPLERPNIFVRPKYLFCILLFPYYDRASRSVKSAELNFFITQEALLTVHSGELIPFNNFWNRTVAAGLKDYADIGALTHKIIDELIKECFPMLAHISNDIDEIEHKLLLAPEKGTIGEILRIKTNIVNFQKTIQGHKSVIRKLMSHGNGFLGIKKMELAYNYLVEEIKEIWEALDSYKSTIDALHGANDSLINYRTSDIMRTLTVFSVVIFVLTLVVSMFNLDLADNPLFNHEYGFRIILGIMALGVIGLLVFFKKKKWF